MAKMNTRFRYMLDNAPAITLRARSAAALTASANTNAVTLDKVEGFWNAGDNYLADAVFAVAVNVDALDLTTGDESYTLELEFGTPGFAASIKTHKVVVKGTGQYVFLVDTETVKAMQAGTVAVRIAATLAGTTPSLDFYAWFAGRPITGN